jgi:hypothetical protein
VMKAVGHSLGHAVVVMKNVTIYCKTSPMLSSSTALKKQIRLHIN